MSDKFIIIDVGNTKSKIAVAEGGVVTSEARLSDHETTAREALRMAAETGAAGCLISSVAAGATALADDLRAGGLPTALLTADMELPFSMAYGTPDTLGTDRIAGAAGVIGTMGRCDAVVIDAGTAITYDFLTADGVFRGGAISPGIGMRYKALHAFTARLPLLSAPDGAVDPVGTTTRQAIHSGVMNGVMAEAAFFIARARQEKPETVVVLSGGDYKNFDFSTEIGIFARPNLVLEGLAYLAQKNVHKILGE